MNFSISSPPSGRPIFSATVGAVASVDITGFSAAFKSYRLICSGIKAAFTGQGVLARFNADATANHYRAINSQTFSADSIYLGPLPDDASESLLVCDISATGGNGYKSIVGVGVGGVNAVHGGTWNQAAAVASLRLTGNGAGLGGGTFTLYGLK